MKSAEDNTWAGFCPHPNHNPPTHIVIPQGQIKKHKCPQCGRESHMKGQEYWL